MIAPRLAPRSGERPTAEGRREMQDNGMTNAMGFVLSCTKDETHETYNIGFSRKHPLQVFEILAGSCQIEEAIYTEGREQIVAQRAATLAILRDRKIAPGVGYYVGDFLAVATMTLEFPKQHLTWGVSEIRSEYARTTREMRSAFPNLAALPTEDATARR